MTPLSSAEQFLAQLVEHQRRLAGFVRTLMADPNDAADVLQEINVYLWRHAADFVPGTNFSAWMLRIARFQVMAWRKRQSRDRLVFDDELFERLAASAAELDICINRHQSALATCMAALSAQDREIITEVYAKASTTPQALAQRIGRSVKGIYASLNRIRMKLLECIERTIASEERS
jgi:RNA polymerase sigma-70 factor (ECF subfamily)